MTTENTPATALLSRPGEAPMTWAMGSLFEQILGPQHTSGCLGLALVTQPPGVATPLHVHTREAEFFHLLDGLLDYRAGDDLFALTPGCTIYLPKGLPHAFRIRGSAPARILAGTVPGGLMSLYDEVGIPAVERRLPADGQTPEVEIARWGEIGPRYGLQVVGPPIPE